MAPPTKKLRKPAITMTRSDQERLSRLAESYSERNPAVAEQLLAELDEIIDLAVEDDRDRLVLIEDGLLSGGKVDDRKPPHTERDAGPLPTTCRVRAAVPQAFGHSMEDCRIACAREAGNAAHETIRIVPGRRKTY